MLKNYFKKYLPSIETVKKHRYLQIFGKFIHSPNLWHMNRRSVSRATACGLFSGFMPIPFQMVLSTGLAIISRANVPISIALVWFSNPITIPPIFYFAYKVGAWILDRPPHRFKIELSWDWFRYEFLSIWKPLIVGSLTCGVIAAIVGYFAIHLLWKEKNNTQ